MRTLKILALALIAGCSTWADRVDDAAGFTRQQDPELAAVVDSLPTVRTRHGALRLAPHAALDQPAAAALLLQRVATRADAPEVRRAVAEAAVNAMLLTDNHGGFGDAWLGLMDDPDAGVRAKLVTGMRRASSRVARTGLAAGLADADPEVRRAAAASVGLSEQGVDATLLVPALDDPDAAVRAAAARALGLRGQATGWDGLVTRLWDEDGGVRRESVTALMRIDASRALRIPSMERLALDPETSAAVQRQR